MGRGECVVQLLGREISGMQYRGTVSGDNHQNVWSGLDDEYGVRKLLRMGLFFVRVWGGEAVGISPTAR